MRRKRKVWQDGGRANRPAPDRKPRRPCAGPRRLQDCAPAFEGAEERRAVNESAGVSFRCRLPGVGREPGGGPILHPPPQQAGKPAAPAIPPAVVGRDPCVPPFSPALAQPAPDRRAAVGCLPHPPGQRVTRGDRSRGKSDPAPRPSAAVVMRVQGFSNTGGRRRDDGAIDPRRTDSHAPRPGQTCGAGLSTKRLFFWTGAA